MVLTWRMEAEMVNGSIMDGGMWMMAGIGLIRLIVVCPALSSVDG
jgi:hypothetical protein